jgi:hypothetical protein
MARSAARVRKRNGSATPRVAASDALTAHYTCISELSVGIPNTPPLYAPFTVTA